MKHLVAAGSAPGRVHLLAERPNQDAYRVLQGPWGAVAVVCDGCGSEPKSGVGAELGASIVADAAARQLREAGSLDLKKLENHVLARLAFVAEAASLEPREHLLFTIVAAAFSGEKAAVFACGDGVVAVDGAIRRLGPYPDNAPPYLAYALGGDAVGFESLFEGPAAVVAVGTDGAADAGLQPYWTDERYLRNPDLLRRSLKLQRLTDDATVALILRRPE